MLFVHKIIECVLCHCGHISMIMLCNVVHAIPVVAAGTNAEDASASTVCGEFPSHDCAIATISEIDTACLSSPVGCCRIAAPVTSNMPLGRTVRYSVSGITGIYSVWLRTFHQKVLIKGVTCMSLYKETPGTGYRFSITFVLSPTVIRASFVCYRTEESRHIRCIAGEEE